MPESSGPGRSRPGRTNLEVILSPYLAVSMLQMFQRKAIPALTEERFYEAVDALVLLLEQTNDEKHRLIPKEEE